MIIGLFCLIPACSASMPIVQDTAKYNRLLAEHGTSVPPDISIMPEFTPDIVVNAFIRNPKEADAIYGNKWMKVRGALVYGPTNEGFGGLDIYYVGLESKKRRMAFIFLGAKHQEQLSGLKCGQILTIVGMYMPNEQYNPKLIGCTLLSVE